MTDREKAIVMAYTGFTMLAGDKLGLYYEYVREKLGHSVMTHEFGYPEVQDAVQEAAREDFIALAKAPAVDAAPVVRCRDCKHRIVNENVGKKGYMSLAAMCELDTGDIFQLGRNAHDPDWFCADGERREDEHGNRDNP